VTVEEFVESWRALVHRWQRVKDDPGTSQALLQDVLESGLRDDGSLVDGLATPPSDEDALSCEVALLRLSALVDDRWYTAKHGSKRKAFDPVGHFCTVGWPALLNPSRDFDLWWYWYAHLGLDENRINPLLHYALTGRHRGLSTRSPWPTEFNSEPMPAHTPVRRAFLFAAYDVDGVVDDYVVDYVRRLAPHGDVFYLADSFLPRDELERIADETVEAWAIPHGRYDFGSYAMLMRDLVGWERLEQYDEVVLVNDSCYAIAGFDHVFERMDRRTCDWWGFQGSKVDFARSTGAPGPIPLPEAKRRFVRDWEPRQMDYLHLSSYFLALRRPAFTEPMFRTLMDQVSAQPTKSSIVAKYEIGLSRVLLASGHDFDTFIEQLYPFHPLYTEDTFELAAQGFPLLKRTFLVENSTKTPDLVHWKERVRAIAPEAPVDTIERNLLRVAPHDQLAMSFSVVTGAEGEVERPRLMQPRRMRREDQFTPTFEHWWAFPVSSMTHHLSGHARAIFESVRDDPSLKKIVLTRSRAAALPGTNTVSVPLRSPEGQHYLLRAGLIIQSDHESDADTFPISDERHLFVVAGDPVSLEMGRGRSRPGAPATGGSEPRPPTARIRLGDSTTGSRILAPLHSRCPDATVLTTGFPATDLIVCPEDTLPADLRDGIEELRSSLAGRRLVLFAGTSAWSGPGSPYSEDEAGALERLLEEEGAVLGLREPPGDRTRSWARALERFQPLDLSARRHPVVEAVYRLADLVVSDRGTSLIDFMVTDRPVVIYDPRLDRDSAEHRLVVEPAEVLPHPVVTTFGGLTDALRNSLSAGWRADDRYQWCRELFFHRTDGYSAWRTAQELRRMASHMVGEAVD
jgi:hypothetical protein